LTYTARAAGTEANFLVTDRQLKASTARRTNRGGQGEKWFTGRDGWYFLKPGDDFHRQDGGRPSATA
jgi:hypothetical protein